MKILLHLVLLFGAIIGLLGQSTAMAMTPRAVEGTSMVAMAKVDDCPEMAMPMQGDMHCKKITWQCIAAMGCGSAAITLPSFATQTAPRTARLAPPRSIIAALVGRTVAPEIDPPAFPI